MFHSKAMEVTRESINFQKSSLQILSVKSKNCWPGGLSWRKSMKITIWLTKINFIIYVISTLETSKPREVVDSFSMTGANYPKVIYHLTNRFGNKDTLVEKYFRKLLKLVLSNALNLTKRIGLATLYDKLETCWILNSRIHTSQLLYQIW